MPRNLPHLFLRNPNGISRRFDMSRKVDNEEVDNKPAESYRSQKNRLGVSYHIFINERRERLNHRTLDVPAQIDYIEIHFYIVFGDNAQFKTRSKFENDFGLSPVRYSNFNKSVLFAISHEDRFQQFIDLLYQFINCPDDVLPRTKEYAIATTIHDFEFLSREKILGYSRGNVILDIVNVHRHISNEYDRIKASLFPYLQQLEDAGRIISFQSDGDTSIEIHDISDEDLIAIADNFDILCAAHSLRVPQIRPDRYNAGNLTWGITIQRNPNGHLIGVLDNGVRPIAPLSNVVVDPGIDITTTTSPDATQAIHPHGTIVASLAAVGTQLFETGREEFIADANILPIKIIQNFDGTFGMYGLIAAIRQAVSDYNVRIFNLSVCTQGKMYNEPPSVLAYHMDRLAYDLDILIFISAGNLEENSIQDMRSPEWWHHPFHQYPNHFYDPGEHTDCHVCEATNICAPAESLNNMTVGATADNFREDSSTDLTLAKELPAFYTRKNHYDYGQLVNGTAIKQSQTNRNISKPDIVMPGGDRLSPQSGMQVFGFGENGNDFYIFDSGTSLATPLAANLAAKILNRYPNLSMQSVKALIINSAEQRLNDSFLEEVEEKIKNRLSLTKYGKNFANLSKGQKIQVSRGFNRQNLYRNLVGYGQPDESRLLYSTDKSVTLVLEDTITNRTHKVIPIRIPSYLLERAQSNAPFSIRQSPYFRGNAKISFRKNLEKSTVEYGVDMKNVNNRKNIFFGAIQSKYRTIEIPINWSMNISWAFCLYRTLDGIFNCK